MSKASEWAKLQRKKPRSFLLPDDRGKKTVIFEVDRDGDLSLGDDVKLDWTYKPKEALAAAKWLVATFGEPKP